jgi:hypothetical protein
MGVCFSLARFDVVDFYVVLARLLVPGFYLWMARLVKVDF